ncbi:L domain-like protein [Aureobasidium pullulans]|uniref:L domain-like protein n=1 Tax=Aureobasidium pullulans TaxID=5580 RepID=A0A4S9L9D2_AURPU|nr:L domain-like protein [Aureobasidium pullulans]THW29243.1 L domain-like protein [Aureobasidium pullulans]THX13660.1 L domain-like protein [Aureobasidium pullulans]THY25165.1 L domain-like protein [Aureobasidium pullulans]THY53143.1 L domain-like protein [Aureobasidium pullulans]
MDNSTSATPLRSSGIPKFSSIARPSASRLPAPNAEQKPALPSPTKSAALARPSPAKKALPRPPSSGIGFRSSISGPSSGIIPPRTSSHRPTHSISDRSIAAARQPASRPVSYIAQSRRPASSVITTAQQEDLNDQLGSLDGFRSASRAASRQGDYDESQPFDYDDEPSTPNMKRASRISLSDRTVESLSRLPETPGTDRRRSSFFAPQSPMGPPSRPASAMSTGDAREGSQPKPIGRTASPSKRSSAIVPPSSKMPNKYSTPRAPSSIGLASSRLGRPASVAGKSALTTATPKSTAPKPLQRTSSLRQPGAGIAATPRPRPTTSNSTPAIKTRPTPATALKVAPPKESQNASEKAPSSSAALRDQIAKAKAAKRTPAVSKGQSSVNHFDDSRFDPFADPFNTKPQDGNGLLRKRIDAARSDGRLNLAGLSLKQIPDDVLTMYDQREDSNMNWSQMTDLVRFVAADNELDTISDDIFPDIATEVAMDDEKEVKGLQFRSVEMIDFHGNNLQTVPSGLRWMERLTVLNLSHNKLGNSIFDTIGQLEALKELKLGNNNLSGYLPPSIGRLQNLRTLELQSNKLLSLPDGLRELANLQILNVAGNQLTGLPMDVLETLPIVDLNACNNAMVGALFPFSVSGLSKLEYLDVANNSLASLAFSENLSLPAIKTINIASNRIVALPDMSGWKELVSLAAADNKVSMLPQGFTSLKYLKQADLTGNEITKLHDNIGLMDSLDVLKIAANPLRERKLLNMSTEELKRSLAQRLKTPGQGDRGDEFEDEGIDIQSPHDSGSQWGVVAGTLDLRDKSLVDDDADVLRSIFSSEDVRELKLARNNFVTVPFEISLAQNLKILDLSNCSLGDNYLSEVVTLQALQELFLGSNKISNWEPLLSLLHAPRLSYLDVSNNRLIGSVPMVRDSFPSLKVLHAGNNRIDAVSAEALSGLQSVDLADNNIGYIPPEIGLLWDQGLKGLSIGGNVFRVPGHRILEKGTEATMIWLRDKIPQDDETF